MTPAVGPSYDDAVYRILGSNGKKMGVLRLLVCFLNDNDAVVSTAAYASVYGLVVITAERYFKIVHPVVHRNRYRRWMTYVGVAMPWLAGLLTSAVHTLAVTRFVDGTCRLKVPKYSAYIFKFHLSRPTYVECLLFWRLARSYFYGTYGLPDHATVAH